MIRNKVGTETPLPEAESNKLGIYLRGMREDMGLSQLSVAIKMSTSTSHLGRLESGQKYPNYSTLLKWLKALGIKEMRWKLIEDTLRLEVLDPEMLRCPHGYGKHSPHFRDCLDIAPYLPKDLPLSCAFHIDCMSLIKREAA